MDSHVVVLAVLSAPTRQPLFKNKLKDEETITRNDNERDGVEDVIDKIRLSRSIAADIHNFHRRMNSEYSVVVAVIIVIIIVVIIIVIVVVVLVVVDDAADFWGRVLGLRPRREGLRRPCENKRAIVIVVVYDCSSSNQSINNGGGGALLLLLLLFGFSE